MEPRVRAFLDEVVSWAEGQEDVRAVVLLGSQARTEAPADELSDVDVVLFADEPDRYLGDGYWLRRFGEPILTFVEPTPVGGFAERRVLFRDGVEADFTVVPVEAVDAIPPDAAPVFARGFRILYDDGIGFEPPAGLEAGEPPPPTQEEFDRVTTDFWYHVLWAAKKLRRGEVLLAKQVCDCWLIGHLVGLARWRAHGTDTWHGLRFFERWAGDDVVEALAPTFAAYDAEDVSRALRATAELFARLEDEVAGRFGLAQTIDRNEVLTRLA